MAPKIGERHIFKNIDESLAPKITKDYWVLLSLPKIWKIQKSTDLEYYLKRVFLYVNKMNGKKLLKMTRFPTDPCQFWRE
jgi:hypothetical protein